MADYIEALDRSVQFFYQHPLSLMARMCSRFVLSMVTRLSVRDRRAPKRLPRAPAPKIRMCMIPPSAFRLFRLPQENTGQRPSVSGTDRGDCKPPAFTKTRNDPNSCVHYISKKKYKKEKNPKDGDEDRDHEKNIRQRRKSTSPRLMRERM